MNKIKVAFFAEILIEDFDGASRTMFQLIKRIPQHEYEFLFICGTGPKTLVGFECLQVPSVTLPINVSYKMALPQLAQAKIKEKLKAFDPDVVHIATPSLLGEFALKYARKNEIPVISIYHTHFISYIDYYLKHTPFLIEFAKSMIATNHKNFYNCCDKIYIPSESMAAELSGMGIEHHRMQIWKRGINTSLFTPAKRDVNYMRRLTGNNKPTILFASRLVWEKNLETLFKIYDGLLSDGMPCNLVIAGDGVALKQCRERMKKAVFTGKLNHDELAVLYASADIFLFTSVSETYGNVVIEAMASGLACVIADGGGSKDFIKQGINGFKCAPFNAENYLDKIHLLLANEDLLQLFSKRGRAYSENFDWAKLADIYFDDVRALANKPQLLKTA